jgi:two-component system, sensor histidine kinase and response regulator
LRMALGEVCDLLGPKAADKGLTLALRYPAGTPTRFIGDSMRIRQVVLNLLGNAIKFTERGSAVLAVAAVPLAEQRFAVRISIRDTGIGIDAATAARLFDRFTQADESTTRRFGGTGLGLAISRRLVELMQGRIGLEAPTGQGSTFWFELEMDADESATQEPDAAIGAAVLVVDDDLVERSIVVDLLAAWGCTVAAVDDEAQAAAALRGGMAAGGPWSVALCALPRNRPITADLLGSLRLVETAAPMRFVAMGGVLRPGQSAVLRAAGFAAHVTRPVRAEQLHAVLQQVTRVDPGATTDSATSARVPLLAWTPRVLVIDDNRINQLVAERMLQALGCDVFLASDGPASLQLASQHEFALILMDCRMTGMDGCALPRDIRAVSAGRRTPIVGMASDVEAGERQRWAAAGVDDFVSKPLEVVALRRVIGLRSLPPSGHPMA